jgi:hypothetical protein
MTEQNTNPTPTNGKPEVATVHDALANVQQLVPGMEKRVIEVPEDDARVAREDAAELAAVYQEIGEEYMRHRFHIANLTQRLSEKQAAYSNTVGTLSKKHVKEKGQYDFLPDIGAFVGIVPKPPQGE